MRNINKRATRCVCFIAIVTSLLLSGCGQDDGAHQANSSEQPVAKGGMMMSASLASPTPIVPVAGPAVLGGQLGAFVEKFGSPNEDSDPSFDSYSFKHYGASKTDYLRVVGDLGDGQQWTPYVYLIVVDAPPQQPWDSSTADALCSTFLPTDARYVSQSLDIGGQGNLQGINILYFSALLKTTLPATQFNDAQHNRVESGLLDIYYSFVHGNQNSIDSCTLVPGTLAA
jgi:hypothetical protein